MVKNSQNIGQAKRKYRSSTVKTYPIFVKKFEIQIKHRQNTGRKKGRARWKQNSRNIGQLRSKHNTKTAKRYPRNIDQAQLKHRSSTVDT